jgi:GNAT superfamily N-acetyltransferase
MTRTAMVDWRLRAATSRDRDDVTILARAAVPAEYHELVLEPLASYDDGTDERVIVAVADGDCIVGFALHRLVAGARGAGQLQAVGVQADRRGRGIGGRLVQGAVAAQRDAGARFTLVELPDDPALEALAATLGHHGFREETRAADLVRDGVAMRYLRRDVPR